MFSFIWAVLFAATPRIACAQIEGAGGALTGQHRPLSEDMVPNKLYRLEPGDALDVSFRYTPEMNDQVVVSPDGRITLKAAGVVRAAGLTVPELTDAIRSASTGSLVDPELTVTLKDYDRPHVFVAGEVNTPGKVELRRPTTALQAILASGGPKDDAALGRVLLFRRIDADTAEVHVLKLDHYGTRSREKNDMLLQPDDMILVRHDLPSRIEHYIKVANFGLYLNPLQNVSLF